MNRNAWTEEDRAQYELICQQAWAISRSQAERTDEFLRLMRDAEQAHRFFAVDSMHTAMRTGAAAQLKSWSDRQRTGRIPVRYDGRVISQRRTLGTTYVDSEGNAVPTQGLFDFWTREQLEAKAADYAANIRAYRVNLSTIMRLLDLLDGAPGALTPAEAALRLGTTVEDVLVAEGKVAA